MTTIGRWHFRGFIPKLLSPSTIFVDKSSAAAELMRGWCFSLTIEEMNDCTFHELLLSEQENSILDSQEKGNRRLWYEVEWFLQSVNGEVEDASFRA